MTDSELVRRLQAGETEAFGELLDRYGAKIYNLAGRAGWRGQIAAAPCVQPFALRFSF